MERGHRAGRPGRQRERDGTVRIWDAPRPLVLRAHEGDSVGVAFSPDGRRIASTGRLDHLVEVQDLTAKGGPVVFRGHTEPVWTASFSPDGRRVATASNDGTVRIWSMTGEPAVVLRGNQGSVRGRRSARTAPGSPARARTALSASGTPRAPEIP
jgi:WD40 repeat protein